MSHILIVGPSTASLRNYLEQHGHIYTRLMDRLQTKYPDETIPGRVITDFSDEPSYVAAARDIQARQPIDGIVTTYENSILAAAVIAKALGLPGLPVEAAEACTDKFLMRTRFGAAPQTITPEFSVVNSEQGVLNFANNHAYPLILKPANLAKSLLVTKNHNEQELLRNFRKAVKDMPVVYRKYSPHRKPKLLIEEFMAGSIHSVDAFVDADGTPRILDAIVDYRTGYDVGFDDNFHYSRLLPSKLTADEQAVLKEVAAAGCRSLGMKSSPAHIEVIMTPDGPRIVEIGARNGGYRERMHRLANGFDIMGAALQLAMGVTPDITINFHYSCALLELFPKRPGKFVCLAGEDETRKLASFVQCNIKVKPGQPVGKAADGHKMCAWIILHNTDPEMFARDLAWVEQNVFVETAA